LGIIQPISLRISGPDSYQIIAGERRYRAALKAGLTTIPAYIRPADDVQVTEMALIENIQREDLNAIEIALTFKKLIDRYNLTQERLSERIGKKRATIANFLRLLRLPAEVQLGLRDKRIDMGHARALLSVDDPKLQLKLYNDIVRNGLSVRRVEELAKKLREQPAEAVRSNSAVRDYDILRDHLSHRFSTPVKVSCDASGKGKISFSFSSDDELQRLIAMFDNAK
ncbi:MAG: ParB/RepB/Spo0J family partition protein, partial [Duncaniella sp.]|nr:ParB/RepB/Spo0J family partition protein [Duncaniella sp.]